VDAIIFEPKKQFILGPGMLSIVAGGGLQIQKLSNIIMPSESAGLLMHLFGAMAIFLGIMLIFCSRDLQHRGCLVVWEGGLMAGYGILAGGGLSTIAGGFLISSSASSI
jgi:hypothetical protein